MTRRYTAFLDHPFLPLDPPETALTTTRVTRAPRALALMLLATLALANVGCQKQLFPDDEPRSQYDRFNTVRDRRAPRKFENALGENKINLKGRLLNRPE